MILDFSPDAIRMMLDDINDELGDDNIAFLFECKVLGRVVAVMLECKAAGKPKNLIEALGCANVDGICGQHARQSDTFYLDDNDLDTVIEHALPAMEPHYAELLSKQHGVTYLHEKSIFALRNYDDLASVVGGGARQTIKTA